MQFQTMPFSFYLKLQTQKRFLYKTVRFSLHSQRKMETDIFLNQTYVSSLSV